MIVVKNTVIAKISQTCSPRESVEMLSVLANSQSTAWKAWESSSQATHKISVKRLRAEADGGRFNVRTTRQTSHYFSYPFYVC